ncbi:GGDEF domain-containing protein [Paramagnetospirillum kuznetsovii]|uniref:diguanylate cyclase n=1 Tax=Paramagnetospirillum kuznetsovii TaxID=2053833 RepID=A0A364NXL7_9PROT|nr:GGDEF domain-containing protein [Paramagnetospirillum kuznetsovii]RAU21635.1 GGDEF domain-containing protein [Paramagnetospirillum kuznetsovii]
MDSLITPETVLSSVIRITEQRSRQHLEHSLVSTLRDLAGLTFCGICRPTQSVSGIFIDYVAHEGGEAPDQLIEIGQDPLLMECMATGGSKAQEMEDGALRRAQAIVDDRGIVCAFLVTISPAAKMEQLALIGGFASIYRNYLAILRDAARDTLTGLKNRKTFDENFSRIVASSRHLEVPFAGNRRGGELSGEHHWLAIIDIDHFKRVNDTYGHVFGDEVLLLLAALMRKAFRGEDLLFRFGGEEFVVMLAPTTYENAQAVFDRFRATVGEFAFPQVGHVSVSIGFVRIHSDDLPSVVIGNADKALYYAKEHGRDQVRSFERLLADGSLTDAERTDGDAELF